MIEEFSDVSIKGKLIKVPAVHIGDHVIIISGRWLRIATIKGETWTAGDVVGDPEEIIAKLKRTLPSVDIFSFFQKLPSVTPKYDYHIEWDNVAAIPLTTFNDWWENRLSQVTRKNVRRAARRGSLVKNVEFDDALVRGIVDINNETPVRDGRPFWHYGKDFETVKKDYSAFLDRSDFLGAYFGNELIGILRILYLGEIASVMQLLCKNAHYDKRPANSLLAKAVELCADRGLKYLVYGKYVYDENTQSPLTEFKRRNGFEQYSVPSYFIPLTLKGRLAIRLNIHMGLKRLIPKPIMHLARRIRRKLHEKDLGTGARHESEKDDAQ